MLRNCLFGTYRAPATKAIIELRGIWIFDCGPKRSCKFDSQKRGRPRDGLLLFGAVLNQHALHDGCVGFAPRFHEGSAIDVHRGGDVGMAHEFLLYTERSTRFVEPSAITVAKRVPADPSLNLGS
jgi:hypothetical protein